MPKHSIRMQLLADRKSCPAETCAGLSVQIQRRFLESDLFRDAACIALYSPVQNEVLTAAVAGKALEVGKRLLYPRIKGDFLEFVEVLSLAELAPGAFGVLEPIGRKLMPPEALDLVVVPGIAFDRSGHRLGYGRGFYDRVLARCRVDCIKVGLAYDFQLIETLPAAEHDKQLSVLITESQTLTFTADGCNAARLVHEK